MEEGAFVLVCNFEEERGFCRLCIEALRMNSCQTEGFRQECGIKYIVVKDQIYQNHMGYLQKIVDT